MTIQSLPGLPGYQPPKPDTGEKARLLTLDDLDKRTRAAQRAFEFRDALVAERGGEERLSTVQRAMINSVAVMSTMIQDFEVRYLKGEEVDIVALTTLLNARRREAQLVGINPEPKDVTPSIGEYARHMNGEARR